MLQQMADVSRTPKDLPTPFYTILKKFKEFEIRRCSAQSPLPLNSILWHDLDALVTQMSWPSLSRHNRCQSFIVYMRGSQDADLPLGILVIKLQAIHGPNSLNSIGGRQV